MSIKAICDGCAVDTDDLDDSAWRTIEIDLGYLPESRELGSCDSIARYVFCPQCVNKVSHKIVDGIAAMFAQ